MNATQAQPVPQLDIPHIKARIRQLAADGAWDDAFKTAMRLLLFSPANDDIWQEATTIARRVTSGAFDDECMQCLTGAITRAPSNPHAAVMLGLQALCAREPLLAAHMQLATQRRLKQEELDLTQCDAFLAAPLMHALLRLYVIPHAGLERLLTLLRAHLLQATQSERRRYLRLLLSLATQASINGYVYFCEAWETEAVETLGIRIESGQGDAYDALLYACYKPPFCLKNIEYFKQALATEHARTSVCRFLTLTIDEPLAERELMCRIVAWGKIEDVVSVSVGEQYEEHPYPRWLHLADIPAEAPVDVISRFAPQFDASVLELSDCPQILAAGCGTGKQALEAAKRYKNCHVTALDISRASLAYAMRKTAELFIENVEYAQADILSLTHSVHRFDMVECTGVLHHMQKPIEGWRALSHVLKPGGVMKIALYSAKARESITRCRQQIAQEEIGQSEDEIRRFRQRLMSDDQMQRAYPFTLSTDFYSMPECRDLLFHRQEHCFSIPHIAQCLQDLGLKFICFDIANLQTIQAYIHQFPQDKAWNNLENWRALESMHPLMFFGMYQFWCYKPKKGA